MAIFEFGERKVRSIITYISAAVLVVIGLLSIVFFSPSRTFHVRIGDYDDYVGDEGVAHADVPAPADPGAGGDSGGDSAACGEGCGEGCGGEGT